jgi:hypothetical protein
MKLTTEEKSWVSPDIQLTDPTVEGLYNLGFKDIGEFDDNAVEGFAEECKAIKLKDFDNVDFFVICENPKSEYYSDFFIATGENYYLNLDNLVALEQIVLLKMLCSSKGEFKNDLNFLNVKRIKDAFASGITTVNEQGCCYSTAILDSRNTLSIKSRLNRNTALLLNHEHSSNIFDTISLKPIFNEHLASLFIFVFNIDCYRNTSHVRNLKS